MPKTSQPLIKEGKYREIKKNPKTRLVSHTFLLLQVISLSQIKSYQLSVYAQTLSPTTLTACNQHCTSFLALNNYKKKCHNLCINKMVKPNTIFNKYTSSNPTNIIGPNFNHQQHMGLKFISIRKLGPNLTMSSQRQKIKIQLKTNERNNKNK